MRECGARRRGNFKRGSQRRRGRLEEGAGGDALPRGSGCFLFPLCVFFTFFGQDAEVVVGVQPWKGA